MLEPKKGKKKMNFINSIRINSNHRYTEMNSIVLTETCTDLSYELSKTTLFMLLGIVSTSIHKTLSSMSPTNE